LDKLKGRSQDAVIDTIIETAKNPRLLISAISFLIRIVNPESADGLDQSIS
jgi:hypothetical protein